MKNLFTLILLAATSIASAQNKIVVTESMVAIDGTSRNSMTVIIEDANTDAVKKAWKKQLKELKGKVSDKTIIFGDDCKLKEMGDNTFDVYSLVENAIDEGVRLVVAFDLGGAYLSTANHPNLYPAAEKIVYGFALAQAKAVILKAIESSKKVLSGLEKILVDWKKKKLALKKTFRITKRKSKRRKPILKKTLPVRPIRK